MARKNNRVRPRDLGAGLLDFGAESNIRYRRAARRARHAVAL